MSLLVTALECDSVVKIRHTYITSYRFHPADIAGVCNDLPRTGLRFIFLVS